VLVFFCEFSNVKRSLITKNPTMIKFNTKDQKQSVKRFYQDSHIILNRNFHDINNDIFNLEKTEIIHCNKCTEDSYIIPDTIIHIGIEAFAQCKALTSVVIPKSVLTIGMNAFWNCSSLQSIILQSNSPIYLLPDTDIFYNVDKTTCVLYVPEGSKSLYQLAEQWKEFKNIQELIDVMAFNRNDLNHKNYKIAI